MNRRLRRQLARDVAKRQGLKGREKQRVSSLVAKQLPGGSMQATSEQLEAAREARRPKLESPTQRQLVQRESGLVVPE